VLAIGGAVDVTTGAQFAGCSQARIVEIHIGTFGNISGKKEWAFMWGFRFFD
jgi:hypothetical protein